MNERDVKVMVIIVFLLTTLGLHGQPPNEAKGVNRTHNFKCGEQLDFKLSYGWFTVGKAQISISPEFHTYKGKECYKIDIQGSTAGLLGVFTSVNDSWGAYVTSYGLEPLHAYRDIQEGRYVRVERTFFDHEQNKVEVLRYDPRKEDHTKPRRIYDTPTGVKDIMSAFLHLRNTDFSRYQIGDTITIDTFYEDELYHFKLLIDRLGLFDSKVGEIYAYKVYLLLPTNDLFPEEKGIFAWISSDFNHLPLRIEAEMFFGRAYCDLVSYRNLKYGPDYQ